MKKINIFIILAIMTLFISCNTFYNDDSLSEFYDYGRTSVNVIYRIEHNEQMGYPFILNKEKTEKIKKEHGTEYVYQSKTGKNIRIFAVYKIFNKPDQSYYYILENESGQPVANVKLVTNKKGKVIKVEVISGK